VPWAVHWMVGTQGARGREYGRKPFVFLIKLSASGLFPPFVVGKDLSRIGTTACVKGT
jgi:hypothetical protein